MRLELIPEQEAFRTTVEVFASDSVRPQAAVIDTSDRFPRELVQQAGALGLMGVTIPTAWGGARLRQLCAGD